MVSGKEDIQIVQADLDSGASLPRPPGLVSAKSSFQCGVAEQVK